MSKMSFCDLYKDYLMLKNITQSTYLILGLAPSNDNPRKALDGKFFTTLLYGNGPGYQGHYTLLDNGYLAPLLNYTTRRNISAEETGYADDLYNVSCQTDSTS